MLAPRPSVGVMAWIASPRSVTFVGVSSLQGTLVYISTVKKPEESLARMTAEARSDVTA
jgi:hypothetical protein